MRYFSVKVNIYGFIKFEKGKVFGLNEETNEIYYDKDSILPTFIKLDLFNKCYFDEIKEDNLFNVGSEVIYYGKKYIISCVSIFDKSYILKETNGKQTKVVSFDNSAFIKRVKYYWFISSKGVIQKDFVNENDSVFKYRAKIGNCFYTKEDAYNYEVKIVKK